MIELFRDVGENINEGVEKKIGRLYRGQQPALIKKFLISYNQSTIVLLKYFGDNKLRY